VSKRQSPRKPLSPSPRKKPKVSVTRLFETLREPLMFLVGLSGVIWEFRFHVGPERFGLLALFGAMMGLPIVLGSDIWRQRRNGYESDEDL
jgi:hypothetical protein